MFEPRRTPRESTDTGKPVPVHPRAIGAVRIQLQSAHLESGICSLAPLPNPLVEVSVNETQIIGRTRQVYSTLNPYWSQTFYALIRSSQDVIIFSVLSHRQYLMTRLVGKAFYTAFHLEREPFQLGITERLWKRQKERGSILFDLVFYRPIAAAASEDDSTMGIVTLTIYEARGLWCSGVTVDRLRPGVVVRSNLNEADLQATPYGFSSNPQWHSQCEILAVEGRRTRLLLQVKDAGNQERDLGHVSHPLGDLLSEVGEVQDGHWWPLVGSPKGQLRFKVEWTGLSIGQESMALL